MDRTTAKPDDRTLELVRFIPAPRAAVWAAWTDPDRLPRWWGPRGFTCRTREINIAEGGVWRFDMIGPDGTVYPNRHRFTRISPQTAIGYSVDDDGTGDHHFDGYVRFEDRDQGTRVTLTMVFPTPQDRKTVEDFGAVALGYTTLDRLAETALPGHAVSLTRLLPLPPARLWQFWTDPRHLAHWFVPDGLTIAATDFRPVAGADWRTDMRAPQGGHMIVQGRFRVVDPPRTLVFTHGWQDDAGDVPVETQVRVTLTPHGRGTRLILLQTGLASGPSRDGHREGWSRTLDALDTYAARA